jgi:hypothetical protein
LVESVSERHDWGEELAEAFLGKKL